MAIQTINTGASDDDPSADTARAAFTKVNENFTEVEAVVKPNGVAQIGDIALKPDGGLPGHMVFQSQYELSGVTRVYIQPREDTLGHTPVTNGVVSSVTAFFDAYDDQIAESQTPGSTWTGSHYRDGGFSLLVGPSYNLDYGPAGITWFNSKTGGNWLPYHPPGTLAIDGNPMVTVFKLPPTKALPGPTFAGGGVYPSDIWRPGKAYSVGDIVHYYYRVYEVTGAGTSGTIPPRHDGVGNQRADAWDEAILTTVGTLATRGSGDFYVGTDSGTGGGTVEYALIEQMIGPAQHRVALLGLAEAENPMLELGDGVQLAAPLFIKPNQRLKFCTVDAGGAGTETGFEIWGDANGNVYFGDDGGRQIRFIKSNNDLYVGNPSQACLRLTDTKIQALNGYFQFGTEIVKTNGATTVDVSGGVSIIKFSDTAATNFTGFTGAEQGQRITLIFNNTNTTLKHSTSFRLATGADIIPNNNQAIDFVMRSATVAQMVGGW